MLRCAHAARTALLRRRAPAACRPRLAASAAAQPTPPSPPGAFRFAAPSRRATTSLAQLLADASAPGDVLCLHGAVGAGKSFFWCVVAATRGAAISATSLSYSVFASRAFVRAVADDALLPVPSPTYLLLQAYEEHAGPCAPRRRAPPARRSRRLTCANPRRLRPPCAAQTGASLRPVPPERPRGHAQP